MKKTWTEDEIQLLYSSLTSLEIAERLNRSKKSVDDKRWRVTGHCSVSPGAVEVTYSSPEPWMTKECKVLRIKELALRLGVKLLGKE